MSDSVRPVALVTGSSRGLGAAIAARLARDGFTVAVNALPGDAGLDHVVAGVRDMGGRAEAFAADVTDAADSAAVVAAVEERLGPVEVLVLNATGPQPDALIEDTGWEQHLAQLLFFVKSPVLVGGAVLPRMRARGRGRIVHIDTEVALRPPVGRSAYVTAKAAQIGIALSWARELAPYGITVNSVAPGFIPVERHADLPPEVVAAYRARVPMGRMGTPEDVAQAVSFFAAPASGFITGQRIIVDGGHALD